MSLVDHQRALLAGAVLQLLSFGAGVAAAYNPRVVPWFAVLFVGLYGWGFWMSWRLDQGPTPRLEMPNPGKVKAVCLVCCDAVVTLSLVHAQGELRESSEGRFYQGRCSCGALVKLGATKGAANA